MTDKATIMLLRGDLESALVAFEIALGYASMGDEVTIWFTLYGVNAIRKPQGFWQKLRKDKRKASIGRIADKDIAWQKAIKLLNGVGPKSLPLAQLNLGGVGVHALGRIMKNKGMADLETMIRLAVELGIRFRICQLCVDIFALNVDEDLIIKADVAGVSTYVLDSKAAHYNVVI